MTSKAESANGKLSWPSWRCVLPQGRQESLRERIKYALCFKLADGCRNSLLTTISSDEGLRTLYSVHPELFHAPLSAFVDRRKSTVNRFESAAGDLECSLRIFGGERISRWARGGIDCISEPAQGIRICLSLNKVNPQEGLWALSLRDESGASLYNLSFAFEPNGALVVASVQGPAGESADRREDVRRLTKVAHGLRPTHLLLDALRIACARWGTQLLLAVDPAFHVKGRWNHRHRLKFGYRDLWLEVGGQQRADGYWALPLTLSRREIDSVPSRKRSMYRKRFEMLDCISSDLAESWIGRSPTAA